MSCTQTTVYVVEDSPAIRERLIEMLAAMKGVAVVGDADTPGAAITGILNTHPQCVVLDYQLVGGTGVEVLRALHPVLRNTVFVVLTNHPSPQYRRVCVDAGADAFFDKTTEFEKIKDVIAAIVPQPC